MHRPRPRGHGNTILLYAVRKPSASAPHALHLTQISDSRNTYSKHRNFRAQPPPPTPPRNQSTPSPPSPTRRDGTAVPRTKSPLELVVAHATSPPNAKPRAETLGVVCLQGLWRARTPSHLRGYQQPYAGLQAVTWQRKRLRGACGTNRRCDV